MTIRSAIATWALHKGRSIGRSLGCELEVTLDNQRIQTKMIVPGEREGRFWDRNLYSRGQLYPRGYATPIKPTVDLDNTLAEFDQADIEHSQHAPDDEAALTDGSGEGHVDIMSSELFKQHNQNKTISELITPEEQWNKIYKALLALAGTVLIIAMVAVWLGTGGV